MAVRSIGAQRSVAAAVASIVLAVTEGPDHSLADLAQRCGLSLSTAQQLTSELMSSGLLERTSDGRYRAGRPLRMIGNTVDEPPDLRERASSVMEDLVRETRCRARLGVLNDGETAHIDQTPDSAA